MSLTSLTRDIPPNGGVGSEYVEPRETQSRCIKRPDNVNHFIRENAEAAQQT